MKKLVGYEDPIVRELLPVIFLPTLQLWNDYPLRPYNLHSFDSLREGPFNDEKL